MLRHLHPPGGPQHQGPLHSFTPPTSGCFRFLCPERALFQAPAALICSCPFPPPPPPPPLGLLSLSLSLQPLPSVWPETSPRCGAFFASSSAPAFAPLLCSLPLHRFFLPAGWLAGWFLMLSLSSSHASPPPPLLIPSSGLCGLISLLLGQPAPHFSVSPFSVPLFFPLLRLTSTHIPPSSRFSHYYSSPPVSPFPPSLLSVLSLLKS